MTPHQALVGHQCVSTPAEGSCILMQQQERQDCKLSIQGYAHTRLSVSTLHRLHYTWTTIVLLSKQNRAQSSVRGKKGGQLILLCSHHVIIHLGAARRHCLENFQ